MSAKRIPVVYGEEFAAADVIVITEMNWQRILAQITLDHTTLQHTANSLLGVPVQTCSAQHEAETIGRELASAGKKVILLKDANTSAQTSDN